MLNFCDFIQVYVFTTNHHLKLDKFDKDLCSSSTADFSVSVFAVKLLHVS